MRWLTNLLQADLWSLNVSSAMSSVFDQLYSYSKVNPPPPKPNAVPSLECFSSPVLRHAFDFY